MEGDEPRCVDAGAPCFEFSGDEARVAPDGTACEGGRICITAACVAPRCGDGILTEPETCDGSDGCRADCTRCGDGVVDAGELCDDGEANSDALVGACGANCTPTTCGDGVIDDGEACDDGNTNPRDGCDRCVVQRFDATLMVSGFIDSRVARTASLSPSGVALDAQGRIFFTDGVADSVVRMNLDGTLTTLAVTGDIVFSGDGGLATATNIGWPYGIAVDATGRVFVTDLFTDRILRIDVDGTITTIAGSGDRGFSGDGGPATNTSLNEPTSVAVDAAGRVVFADRGNHRVRRIDVDGTISTIAGMGVIGFSGDGGPATTAFLASPTGVAIDAVGRVLIADQDSNRIRRVDLDGTITTIAGWGGNFSSDDGGPAANAAVRSPSSVAVDAEGRVLIGELLRVRRVDLDGTITTVAGTGEVGFSGDGGPATRAGVWPFDLAADAAGRIVIVGNSRIRRVDIDGVITTIAGTGVPGFAGDGGPATSARDSYTKAVAIDPTGRLLLTSMTGGEFGYEQPGSVRRVEPDGTITTVAGAMFAASLGDGGPSTLGDGGPATSAHLPYPDDVAVDAAGRIFICADNRVRRVDVDGTITTVAGDGGFYPGGDGGPATSASLSWPCHIAVDPAGRVYIAAPSENRIRRVDVDGIITTFAGTGEGGASGDGGPAVSASLVFPRGVFVDAEGRVFIAEAGNSRIRRVDVDGTITTVAGTGTGGFSGDGGPATSAQLNLPEAVACDASGRVFIADKANERVRRVDVDGTITTIAGTGDAGRAGDGGPASAARLSGPTDIAIDAAGRIFVGENCCRVRRIDVDGTITTVAGDVHPPGPGPSARARLYGPVALAPLAPVTPVTPVTLVSVGSTGRALRIDEQTVSVVVGDGWASETASGQARYAPLLRDARGVAFDPVALTLVITEADTGTLRMIGLDPDDDGVIDDAAAWTNASIATTLAGPAGIAYDDGTDSFIVADERDHCVQRVGRDGAVLQTVLGRCSTPGSAAGLLNGPTHAVVSPSSGAVYVADTANHRVLRVQGGVASVVVGAGSASSAGEGSPARSFPVNAPRQLVLDDFGNLYVASTTTVRQVQNVDGDADADADDRVSTIFGGGARDTYPENEASCLRALAIDDDGVVYVADACGGFMVKLTSVLD